VSGRSRSALTTSSASSRCLSGLRVRARTLNSPLACRARTTPPPCCPVAPITAISFLLLDNMFIPFCSSPYCRSTLPRRAACLLRAVNDIVNQTVALKSIEVNYLDVNGNKFWYDQDPLLENCP